MPRKREEIEKSNTLYSDNKFKEESRHHYHTRELVLEVLLDIRDLLDPAQDPVLRAKQYLLHPKQSECAYFPGECRDINCPKHSIKQSEEKCEKWKTDISHACERDGMNKPKEETVPSIPEEIDIRPLSFDQICDALIKGQNALIRWAHYQDKK